MHINVGLHLSAPLYSVHGQTWLTPLLCLDYIHTGVCVCVCL